MVKNAAEARTDTNSSRGSLLELAALNSRDKLGREIEMTQRLPDLLNGESDHSAGRDEKRNNGIRKLERRTPSASTAEKHQEDNKTYEAVAWVAILYQEC